MEIFNAFIADLQELKQSYTDGVYGPVQHWKIEFPIYSPQEDE
jgi:hypothetical protein